MKDEQGMTVELRGSVDQEQIMRDAKGSVHVGNLGAGSEVLNAILVTPTKKARVLALEPAGGQPTV